MLCKLTSALSAVVSSLAESDRWAARFARICDRSSFFFRPRSRSKRRRSSACSKTHLLLHRSVSKVGVKYCTFSCFFLLATAARLAAATEIFFLPLCAAGGGGGAADARRCDGGSTRVCGRHSVDFSGLIAIRKCENEAADQTRKNRFHAHSIVLPPFSCRPMTSQQPCCFPSCSCG